jgi:hypothetical protein
MEKEYFDWTEWDFIEENVFQFQNCVVKKPFGPYKIGDAVFIIVLDYSKGVIETYTSDETSLSYRGKLFLVIQDA